MAREHYCYTCEKSFHYHGIGNHRAMHRVKGQDCTIRDGEGVVWDYLFDDFWLAVMQGYYGC